ncbi:MAG TPA: Ig-like domain-containing protein [Gemmatimonadaceae bacterium]|nr:Ig-like domain-containing protein [Gemmatimonadaceae bacterium]
MAPRYARLPAGSPVIPLSKVRGVLTDGDGNSIAVEAEFQGDSAVLVFDVAFTGSTANYTLDLTGYDEHGVVAYHASQQITLKPGDNPGVAAPVLVPAGPDLDVKTIAVSPQAVTLNAGGSTNLSVSGKNASGQPAAPYHVGWSSSNPSIATVDENTGAVTAGPYQGSAWIVARMVTDVADSAKITVHAPVATVAVAPATLQLVRGGSGAVGAELRDGGGNLIDDRTATWSSSDPSVAAVDDNGVVKAIAAGTATITATAEGKTGSAAVTVVSPIDHVEIAPASLDFSSLHETQNVKATIVPRSGASVAGIAVAYASSNSAVASVDASGKVTANGNGTATITATAETFTASASVTVQQVAASISISPKTAGVNSIGDTRTFTGAASDALGNAMAIPFTWSSSDESVATVDANGVAKAKRGGTATITASVGGKSASATFNVIPVPQSISIKLDASAILVGQSTTAHASFADANGNPIGDVTPTWSTTTPDVISIGADGQVVGLSSGIGRITASSGSVTGTTAISVSLPPNAGSMATGRVTDAATNLPISGATLRSASGATTTTNADGSFSLTGVTDGSTITITAAGHVGTSYYDVQVGSGSQTQIGTIPLAPLSTLSGSVSGQVIDAVTESPVANAMISARSGINATTGTVVRQISTTESGAFSGSLLPGTYTITIAAVGYATATLTVASVGGTSASGAVVTLSPVGSGNEYRIVLTWDANPSDLDGHLFGPDGSGGQFHVAYFNKTALSSTSAILAQQDVDHTEGFGPETITIPQTINGTYHYLVHQYCCDEDGNMSTGNATVRLFRGSQQIATFFPPPLSGPGEDDVWSVFDLDGATGRITTVNTVARGTGVIAPGGSSSTNRRASIADAMRARLVDSVRSSAHAAAVKKHRATHRRF